MLKYSYIYGAHYTKYTSNILNFYKFSEFRMSYMSSLGPKLTLVHRYQAKWPVWIWSTRFINFVKLADLCADLHADLCAF